MTAGASSGSPSPSGPMRRMRCASAWRQPLVTSSMCASAATLTLPLVWRVSPGSTVFGCFSFRCAPRPGPLPGLPWSRGCGLHGQRDCRQGRDSPIKPDPLHGEGRVPVPQRPAQWLAAQGLRARFEAGRNGVAAGRLRGLSLQARLRLADLFLDMLPYKAHTTASDACGRACCGWPAWENPSRAGRRRACCVLWVIWNSSRAPWRRSKQEPSIWRGMRAIARHLRQACMSRLPALRCPAFRSLP